MKKMLLSSVFIIAFAVYVLQRNLGSKESLTTSSDVFANSNNNVSTGNNKIPINIIYKDGQYVGKISDAYYGNIQVKAIIQNGKISDVLFLDYPQDRSTSIHINTAALPILKTEAIIAQSAQVDVVSGATDTSQAFSQSLLSALNKAI